MRIALLESGECFAGVAERPCLCRQNVWSWVWLPLGDACNEGLQDTVEGTEHREDLDRADAAQWVVWCWSGVAQCTWQEHTVVKWNITF